MRRIRFTDPAPLPADAPEYACEETRKEYALAQARSRARMELFDDNPQELREIEAEVFDPGKAVAIYLGRHPELVDDLDPSVAVMLPRKRVSSKRRVKRSK